MEGTSLTVTQILNGLFAENNWHIAFLPFPVPMTKPAWLATLAIGALVITVAAALRLWLRRRYFGPEMAIDVVDDNADSAPAEMRLGDARQFFEPLKRLRSGQESSVNLLIRYAGATYRSPCIIHMNQTLPERHLKIQRSLALRMEFPWTDVERAVLAEVDVQPPSWWANTFGNPDRSISSQWIVGTALGLIFLFAQTAVGLVMAR